MIFPGTLTYTPAAGVSNILLAGLLGYWKLDETSGSTVADSSSNGYTGTLTGTSSVSGKLSNARSFNGTSDKIDMGNVGSVTSGMSVSAWINASSLSGNRTIISKFGDVSFQNSFIFRTESGVLRLYICNAGGGSFASVTGTTTLSTGTTYHVAATWDGSVVKLYINGALDASGSLTGNCQTCAATLKIGKGGELTGEYWSGWIDEVGLWSRSLVATEVGYLYASNAAFAFSNFQSADTDASAFLTAAVIGDGNIYGAINQLVLDLKSASLWTRMHAIYPFVGGTAASHKWNLKDPRDLDAAFRLTFNGTITHSSTGALPNGSNGWAETYYIPSTYATLYDTHLSYYSRTNSSSSGAGDFSCYGGGDTHNFRLYCKHNTIGTICDLYQYPNARLTASPTTSQRLFVGTRTSTSYMGLFQDGNLLASTTTSTGIGTLPTYAPRLFCDRNESVNIGYGNKECAFASVGLGLTSGQVTDLTNAVNAFQTTLGRNV